MGLSTDLAWQNRGQLLEFRELRCVRCYVHAFSDSTDLFAFCVSHTSLLCVGVIIVLLSWAKKAPTKQIDERKHERSLSTPTHNSSAPAVRSHHCGGTPVLRASSSRAGVRLNNIENRHQ